MAAKIHNGRNGAYVTFEKIGQWWHVILRGSDGNVADKVRCDSYSEAVSYRKSFIKIAKA